MKGIAIYVEGGGNNASAQRRFRHGMNEFLGELKLAAERKNLRWKLVPCGSRSQTYNKFRNAWRQENQTIVVLLVDSEGPVRRKVSSTELLHRRDGWDLSGIAKENVHLMVQTMETWIVSDPDTLARFYGRHFRKNALPSDLRNIENKSKRDIANCLKRATESTQKGAYHKINHAVPLLKAIDSTLVREHCLHCNRLFEFLYRIIEAH